MVNELKEKHIWLNCLVTAYGETRTEERLIIFHYRFLDADNSNGATFKQSFQLCHRTRSANHKLLNSFRGIYLLNKTVLKNKEDFKRRREYNVERTAAFRTNYLSAKNQEEVAKAAADWSFLRRVSNSSWNNHRQESKRNE